MKLGLVRSIVRNGAPCQLHLGQSTPRRPVTVYTIATWHGCVFLSNCILQDRARFIWSSLFASFHHSFLNVFIFFALSIWSSKLFHWYIIMPGKLNFLTTLSPLFFCIFLLFPLVILLNCMESCLSIYSIPVVHL